SISAGQCGNPAVLQAAQAAVGCDPERTVPIPLEIRDTSSTQPVGDAVGRPNLAVGDIREATFTKSKPEAAARAIDDEMRCGVVLAQLGDGSLLERAIRRQTKHASL